MSHHLLPVADLTGGVITKAPGTSEDPDYEGVTTGKGHVSFFEFPIARACSTPEVPVRGLGDHAFTVRDEDFGTTTIEGTEDVAMTLTSHHPMTGARVARHSTLTRVAGAIDRFGRDVPVLILLADREPPSEARADLLTTHQLFGSIEGSKVAFTRDANNVTRSLALRSSVMRASLRVRSASGPDVSENDDANFDDIDGDVSATHDLSEAARGADVLYSIV